MQQCEVQSGETLVSISIREKISVTVLRRINKLYGNEIFPGQILSLRTSSNSPCKEKALLHNKNSNSILGDRINPVATKHQNVMLKMSSEKGRDPIVATSHISAADRPTFSGNLSEMASNIKSAVAFSSEKNQDLIRSLLESMSIPSKENVENGRSRAASSSSIAGLSVSFTDKKVYDDEHYDSLPPILLGNSSILTISHAKQLRKYLPSMQQIENWRLLYSVLNDGADLCSFYRRSKNHKYTIIIAKTMKGEIFGGFQSTCWASASQNFYGSGESFIFKFDSDNNIKQYPWTGSNDFFAWSSPSQIAMGGGGEGFGFVFDSDFATGESFRSATYGNPLLVEKENGSFRVANVECWGFEGLFGKFTTM